MKTTEGNMLNVFGQKDCVFLALCSICLNCFVLQCLGGWLLQANNADFSYFMLSDSIGEGRYRV